MPAGVQQRPWQVLGTVHGRARRRPPLLNNKLPISGGVDGRRARATPRRAPAPAFLTRDEDKPSR